MIPVSRGCVFISTQIKTKHAQMSLNKDDEFDELALSILR